MAVRCDIGDPAYNKSEILRRVEDAFGAAPDILVHSAAAPREFTLRGLLLGSFLAIILGAANAYLGLYAGMTVSASIPAAVISMAVLRIVGGATVLENNVVFGVVNANLRHYHAAVTALTRADRGWLEQIVSRRVPAARWHEALVRGPTDVKPVIVFDDHR